MQDGGLEAMGTGFVMMKKILNDLSFCIIWKKNNVLMTESKNIRF